MALSRKLPVASEFSRPLRRSPWSLSPPPWVAAARGVY